MPTEKPTLSESDDLIIRQSFAAACGITALHLVLENMEDVERRHIKDNIIAQWKGAWTEAFQGQMNEYTSILNKVTNAHKLSAPEDFQVAFNNSLNEAEKMGRVSLGMEEVK